ncbi:hypothetical protein AB0I60_13440 [Actinosynnema sp. NPDC050436]|uniref:hypothetical protein n=1 Tax=Actinosynnema sp. NPDC050436 TaxID=3155659 RepID=UPI0033FBCDAC
MINTPERPLAVVMQVAAVLVGSLVIMYTAGWVVVFGFWVGSRIVVAVAMVPVFGLFYLIGTVTAEAGPLTRTPGWRVLWAALVSVVGLLGVVFYAAALQSWEPHGPTWLLYGGFGVPAALVAAILARGTLLPLGAAAVAVALIAVANTGPTWQEPDNAKARRDALGITPHTSARTDLGAPVLRVEDGRVVVVYPAAPGEPLGPDPELATRRVPATRWDESPAYREDPERHVWVWRYGQAEITTTVSKRVDREAALDLARSARPATDDEVLRLVPPADRPVLRVVDRFTATLRELVAGRGAAG